MTLHFLLQEQDKDNDKGSLLVSKLTASQKTNGIKQVNP